VGLANLPPGSGMTYDEFLARLYERYGLVVGPEEVRQSSLLDRRWINAEYYDRDKAALLEKMKHAGLAVEYSDATAVVEGRSESISEHSFAGEIDGVHQIVVEKLAPGTNERGDAALVG
jgi:hypothetical protein